MNYFRDQYAPMNGIDPDSEDSIRSWYERSVPYYHRELSTLVSGFERRTVLDVGCGIGGALHYLHTHGFEDLHGVDSSSDQLSVCRRYVSAVVVHKDATSFLRAKRSRFDLILLFDVIEHVPKRDIPLMLAALYRSLRPGGRVIVRTPNAGHILGGYHRYIDFTHETAFTEQSIVQVLRTAGFVNIRAMNSGLGKRRLFLLRQVFRLLSVVYNEHFPSVFSENVLAVGDKP